MCQGYQGGEGGRGAHRAAHTEALGSLGAQTGADRRRSVGDLRKKKRSGQLLEASGVAWLDGETWRTETERVDSSEGRANAGGRGFVGDAAASAFGTEGRGERERWRARERWGKWRRRSRGEAWGLSLSSSLSVASVGVSVSPSHRRARAQPGSG
jgi:hypothetical protein